MLKQKNSKVRSGGFSLIELSIVLIIIGLLVAGITSGQSLIESARQRSFINELNDFKNSFFVFKVKYDRLPGDLNNNGIIGRYCSTSGCSADDVFTISSFPALFNTKVPSANAGIFIELFLEGLLKFDLTSDKISDNSFSHANYSKVYKKTSYVSVGTYFNYNFSYNIVPNYNGIIAYIYSYDKTDPKRWKAIDEKIDDGKRNSGNFVTAGNYSGFKNNWTYDDVIENKYDRLCMLYYKIADL